MISDIHISIIALLNNTESHENNLHIQQNEGEKHHCIQKLIAHDRISKYVAIIKGSDEALKIK